MRMCKSVGAVGLMLITVGICLAAGSKAKDTNNPSSDTPVVKTASQLLAGIVHLSDNDIRFRTADGIGVFVDPVAGPADPRVVKAGVGKPDLILITHPHADHFQPAVLREYGKLNPKVVLAGPAEVAKLAKKEGINEMNVVTPGQEYTMAGVGFRTVPAYFLDGQSHPKANQWVGYVLRLNKARYYVTGDTQPLPEMAKVQADVIFPLLYGCGGNIEQAVKMAEISKARIVVPVHTGGPDGLQEDIVKKYLTQLTKPVQGAYYKEAKLILPVAGGE